MFYNSSTQTRQALKRPPKFSIIIPCYKVEKYIRACLDSVLAQKCDSWEIICTDDGSPDETGRVLDDYLREHFGNITEEERVIKAIGDEDRHPEAPKRVLTGVLATGARMTVIHQQNCGVSGARNTAMTLATGEWLVYLDGDDLLSPHAFEIIEKCLEKAPDADIVRCGYVNFNDGEECVWPQDYVDEVVRVINIEKNIPDTGGGSFQRMVFRRDLVKDIAYKGVSCTEEMPYVLKCLVRSNVYIETNEFLYGYRILRGSMSHRGYVSAKFCNDFFDATRCLTRIYSECGKTVSQGAIRAMINRWTEVQVQVMGLVRPKADWKIAWNYWQLCLPRIYKYKAICTRWQIVVATLCIWLPFRPVCFILCRIPNWLKTKGIHR